MCCEYIVMLNLCEHGLVSHLVCLSSNKPHLRVILCITATISTKGFFKFVRVSHTGFFLFNSICFVFIVVHKSFINRHASFAIFVLLFLVFFFQHVQYKLEANHLHWIRRMMGFLDTMQCTMKSLLCISEMNHFMQKHAEQWKTAKEKSLADQKIW